MADRIRVRHDDKDSMMQVKGVTTKKLLANQRNGTVDWQEETDRSAGPRRGDKKK